MKHSEARELFRCITEEYFAHGTVIYSHQSRIAKPSLPLVALHTLNLRTKQRACYILEDETLIGHHAACIPIQVDLFTHGKVVTDDETGEEIAYEDTAVDDMQSFVDFLNSEYVLEWCHKNDVAIGIDGDVQNLTGVVNDTNYEYRSRVTVLFYFTHETVGATSVIEETSAGGGGQELANKELGYFSDVEIKETGGTVNE